MEKDKEEPKVTYLTLNRPDKNNTKYEERLNKTKHFRSYDSNA
jgi:hypothetical protein